MRPSHYMFYSQLCVSYNNNNNKIIYLCKQTIFVLGLLLPTRVYSVSARLKTFFIVTFKL